MFIVVLSLRLSVSSLGHSAKAMRYLRAVCALLVFAATSAFSQQQSDAASLTMVPHPDTWWWVSGQINIVGQGHPDFPAQYSGPNSLRANGEFKVSRLMTLYTGVQATKRLALYADVESSGGRGISDALGLAGFTNLDVVRNPDLGSAPYLARAIVEYTIPLSSKEADVTRGILAASSKAPEHRLVFRIGKFSIPDYFDQNSVGSDSHLQFLNWTVDNNGAYDYSADTRGYTVGAMAEYAGPRWHVRFAETLMPKVANGINLDAKLSRARAENVEIERDFYHSGRKGAVRALSYVNHADMGSYAEAIRLYEEHITSVPVIEATRRQGRIKYGFGLNAEQELFADIRVFGRWGWNEGQNESFAYTEVDETIEAGADIGGSEWRRSHDRIGVALVSNGISKLHQAYLRLGGQGFLLGDGSLAYGREDITESYYTAHLWRGLFASADVQYIVNPGYNRARGPVLVPATRVHVDF